MLGREMRNNQIQGFIDELITLQNKRPPERLGDVLPTQPDPSVAALKVPLQRVETGKDPNNIFDKARDAYFVSVRNILKRLIVSGLVQGEPLEYFKSSLLVVSEIIENSQSQKEKYTPLNPEQEVFARKVRTVLNNLGSDDINDYLATITDPQEKLDAIIKIYELPADSMIPAKGEIAKAIRQQKAMDIAVVEQLVGANILILYTELD